MSVCAQASPPGCRTLASLAGTWASRQFCDGGLLAMFEGCTLYGGVRSWKDGHATSWCVLGSCLAPD